MQLYADHHSSSSSSSSESVLSVIEQLLSYIYLFIYGITEIHSNAYNLNSQKHRALLFDVEFDRPLSVFISDGAS